MKTLIDHGANVGLQDHKGKTPLHYACESGSKEFITYLLENGAEATLRVRDNNGFDVLETMAHRVGNGDHYITTYRPITTLMEYCNFTAEETIKAYETKAARSSVPYEFLHKALLLRTKHDIPKKALDPLECYVGMKECETLGELSRYKNDPWHLLFQAILARERIYQGRYIDLSPYWKRNVISKAGVNCNAMALHLLELFRRNDDYLNFNSILETLYYALECHSKIVHTDTIVEFVRTAMECCERMVKFLEHTDKPSWAGSVIFTCGTTLWYAATFILTLMQRDRRPPTNDHETDKVVARKLLKELWEKFPELTCPVIDYKTPLPHVFLYHAKSDRVMWEFREIFELLVEFGYDVDCADHNGNTLLHAVVENVKFDLVEPYNKFPDMAQDVEKVLRLLVENGSYIQAKNSERNTVLDILEDADRHIHYHTRDVLTTYANAQFPALKHLAAITIRESGIPYQDLLPESLVKFVNLQKTLVFHWQNYVTK